MNIFIIVGIVAIALCLILFVFSISRMNMEKELTKMGNAAARAQNNIVKNNEEILKETADINANIHKDAVKTIVHSVKEGLTDKEIIYCKHCGAEIDTDSTFCKKCGKQQ